VQSPALKAIVALAEQGRRRRRYLMVVQQSFDPYRGVAR
jgi:hypothetical protein